MGIKLETMKMQEAVNGSFCLVLFHFSHGDQSLNFGYVEFKISIAHYKWIYQEEVGPVELNFRERNLGQRCKFRDHL